MTDENPIGDNIDTAILHQLALLLRSGSDKATAIVFQSIAAQACCFEHEQGNITSDVPSPIDADFQLRARSRQVIEAVDAILLRQRLPNEEVHGRPVVHIANSFEVRDGFIEWSLAHQPKLDLRVMNKAKIRSISGQKCKVRKSTARGLVGNNGI